MNHFCAPVCVDASRGSAAGLRAPGPCIVRGIPRLCRGGFSPREVPVAGGGVPTGRIVSPQDTPLCRLWLSAMHRMGVEAGTFGDADRPLF